MNALVAALAIVGFCWLWTFIWRRLNDGSPKPDAIFYALTTDAARISLFRYEAAKDSERRRMPIILCHGLGSNAATFDVDRRVSLARYLAGQGFDVWAVNLRGRPYSHPPKLWGKGAYDWTFSDYLDRDLPAAIALVQRNCAIAKVHWLGISMGGNLAYALMARGTDALASVVTIGSSLDYSATGSAYDKLIGILPWIRWLPFVPYGWFSNCLIPFFGRWPNAVERFNYWNTNVAPEVVRKLAGYNCHNLAFPVLAELATLFRPGGMKIGNERPFAKLVDVKTPVMAMVGDRDVQCPVAAAERTLAALGSNDKRLVTLGKSTGQKEHYSHFDIVVGKNAMVEAYPTISEWFLSHDNLEG